jgi:hypothetical protein
MTPDKFQKKECDHQNCVTLCAKCGYIAPEPEKHGSLHCCDGCWKYPEKHDCPCHGKPSDAVDLQISRIKQMHGFSLQDIDAELRVLVALVRKEK